MDQITKSVLLLTQVFLLAACSGGGDGSSDRNTSAASQLSTGQLIEPMPADGDRFGSSIVILPNGNVLVKDPNESSLAPDAGAVHLYSQGSSGGISI